ncbi:hypothetical protein EJB05_20964 [Eragrostis curvula]|uniref:Uncharacterized protein n=1 Tax=Eragrostis curvula TaxID=38414 RepID=A0A5J9V239_9POAL|nr:hypothetical protein EJB05_20964 [Eragrostis curvula]
MILAATGSRSARSLDESMAVIDYPEVSSVDAEYRKYKEEREVFEREAVALRRMLQEMVGREASVSSQGEDTAELPLHSMLDDCSRLVLELHSVARSREQQIESLTCKSFRGRGVKGGCGKDTVSILERKTLSLVERHWQVLMGIQQLEQVLADVKPGFVTTGQSDHATIVGIVTEELVSCKRNEVDLLHKMNAFSEEKKALADELEEVKAARDAANAEASKAKADLEQMEHKLSTTKEKLSMAVTKGKSLVQHRDSLKQALAEKTGELESFLSESQKKSDALQEAERRVEELRLLLDEKTNEHERCLDELRETYGAWEAAKATIEQLNEANTALSSIQASVSLKDEILQRMEEVMSEATFPEYLLSLEMTDRLGWLVEQKKIADMIFSEHNKVKDILSSFDIPHSVLTAELDSQISWLVSSLNEAKDDAVRLHSESSAMLVKLAAHESKLVSMHEEIDRLTIILLEEKQEKDMLVNEHSELMTLYNAAVNKLSVVSLQNNELVKAFAEFSDVVLEDNEPLDTAKLVQQGLSNIQQRTRSCSIDDESFEKLKTLLYTLYQESTLCKIILEEDMTERSERTAELPKMTQEINVLKNEKDSLQKELERMEEKSSLLREKLSAVSSQNNELVKAFAELSDVVLEDNEPMDTAKLVQQGLSNIQQRTRSCSVDDESFEKLKTLLYTLDQESTLCKIILEEEMTDRSERTGELQKMAQEIYVLKNEKDSLQTELERVEEKSSLLREKLSMAVKKGKGLVHEREGLKKVLDEKSSEIDNLKQALDVKNSEIEKLTYIVSENKSEMENMQEVLGGKNSEIEKLRHDLDEVNSVTDNLKQVLDGKNSEIENLKRDHDEINSVTDSLKQVLEGKNYEVEKFKHALETSSLEIENLKQALADKSSEAEKIGQELDAKNMDIENLKHEIELRESAITDLREQAEHLSLQAAHLENLQADIITLDDEKVKLESMLEEAKLHWHTLADSISSLALPIDQPFQEPLDKISQIAQYIKETEVAKSSLDNELHKANEQITLNASRFSDALSTISMLEDELSKLKDYISSSNEEQRQIQLHTAAVEEELEKTNEELVINANKIEDANATIKSLQDELSLVRSNLSTLEVEKNDAQAKYETELSALNAKLTKCLEELDQTHGNLQSHSTEHHSYLEKLNMLVMDDSLLSLMTEEFGNTISSLREMGLIVKSMREQLTAKGIQTDPVMEDSEFATILSLPDYDSFVTERLVNIKSRKRNIDDMSSFAAIVEQLSNQAEYFSGFFSDLSGYINNNIMLALRALQLAGNNFARTLEEHASLKIELGNKDAQNSAREDELLSLQTELRAMSSNCIYCTQQIKNIFDDVLGLGYAIESATGSSTKGSESEGIVFVLKDEDAGDYAKVADTLLSAINTLKSESEKLFDTKGLVITSLGELKMRLKQAESAAEMASQDRQLYVDRVRVLEEDIKTLQDACNGMELKIRDYQEREGTLKARELDLMSLEHSQVRTERGVADTISKDQLEALVEKVTNLDMPTGESHLQSETATFSSPIDKLFMFIDQFIALRHEVETLKYENEGLQLNVESYAREIEQLREVSRNSDLNNRELESKNSELLEVTVSMERMIRRLGHLGGKDVLEDNNPTTTQGLLSKLEKLIIASSTEAGNAKSTIQEMGAKLQSREKAVDELSTKVKMLEDLYHAHLAQPEASKERAFEASSSAIGSDMSEIQDLGPMGKASVSSVSTAAHARTMRKGSSDHLIVNIGTESERLISSQDSDDKGNGAYLLGLREPNSDESTASKARAYGVLDLLALMVAWQHLVTQLLNNRLLS